MTLAFQITVEDLQTVLLNLRKELFITDTDCLEEENLETIFDDLNFEEIEKQALYGNTMESQTTNAYQEIEKQLIDKGILKDTYKHLIESIDLDEDNINENEDLILLTLLREQFDMNTCEFYYMNDGENSIDFVVFSDKDENNNITGTELAFELSGTGSSHCFDGYIGKYTNEIFYMNDSDNFIDYMLDIMVVAEDFDRKDLFESFLENNRFDKLYEKLFSYLNEKLLLASSKGLYKQIEL